MTKPITKGSFPGPIVAGQRMKNASYLSSLGVHSLASRLLIQAIAQSLDIPAKELLTSVLIAERFGRDWYLWIRQSGDSPLKPPVYHALNISINGRSLGHSLEETATKGI